MPLEDIMRHMSRRSQSYKMTTREQFFKSAAGQGGKSVTLDVIGEGLTVEGKVTFGDLLRIDGQLRGEIVGTGTVFIGPKAQVTADLEGVSTVHVMGKLRGKVRCERLVTYASGSVRGDIICTSLAVDPASELMGSITMPSESSDCQFRAAEAPTVTSASPAAPTAPQNNPGDPASHSEPGKLAELDPDRSIAAEAAIAASAARGSSRSDPKPGAPSFRAGAVPPLHPQPRRGDCGGGSGDTLTEGSLSGVSTLSTPLSEPESLSRPSESDSAGGTGSGSSRSSSSLSHGWGSAASGSSSPLVPVSVAVVGMANPAPPPTLLGSSGGANEPAARFATSHGGDSNREEPREPERASQKASTAAAATAGAGGNADSDGGTVVATSCSESESRPPGPSSSQAGTDESLDAPKLLGRKGLPAALGLPRHGSGRGRERGAAGGPAAVAGRTGGDPAAAAGVGKDPGTGSVAVAGGGGGGASGGSVGARHFVAQRGQELLDVVFRRRRASTGDVM